MFFIQSFNRHKVVQAAAALTALTMLSLAALSNASAQTPAWPNKPIKLIVTFPPGGLTDSIGRQFGQHLSTKLGVPVVVENKPGAGAVIGIDSVLKSPPDGYTFGITTSGTVFQNRVLFTKLPYNLDKDIAPITFFPAGPLVVAINDKIPAKNMMEFLAWAKTNQVNMGTYALGSYPHMVADQLNRTEGTKIQSVHYRGESPMFLDLASGQVQIAIGSYSSFNTVSTKGVRAIGVTGVYRSPKLPDVSTLVEQGVKGKLVTLEGGLPLFAPAGTPEKILKRIADEAVIWANSEQAAKMREGFSIPNKPKNLAETRKDFAEAIPVWIKTAVDLGIKLD
jgi:tripartite-type tricarboxylate transporter receptor subunit TctC